MVEFVPFIKVNLAHTIKSRVLCGAHLATQPSKFGRNETLELHDMDWTSSKICESRENIHTYLSIFLSIHLSIYISIQVLYCMGMCLAVDRPRGPGRE